MTGETIEGPEQGPMKLSEALSGEVTQQLRDELKTESRLVKLLDVMQPEMRSNPDRLSLVSNLIDSQEGNSLKEKVFGAKMDMVGFINERIGTTTGGPEAVKEKQWQYKQAMEGLFSTIGVMQPQEEYDLISRKLGNAGIGTPESRRLPILQIRKQELEQDYGIVRPKKI